MIVTLYSIDLWFGSNPIYENDLDAYVYGSDINIYDIVLDTRPSSSQQYDSVFDMWERSTRQWLLCMAVNLTWQWPLLYILPLWWWDGSDGTNSEVFSALWH